MATPAPALMVGSAFTVIAFVAVQPVLVSVKVMVSAPALMPVTTPVVEPTVASEGSLLVQEPAPDASVSVVDDPIHTWLVPPIPAGSAFTVIVLVTEHPAPDE